MAERLHLIDILSNEGKVIFEEGSEIEWRRSDNQGSVPMEYRILKGKKGPFLTHLSPLNLYGEQVGILLVGVNLNRLLKFSALQSEEVIIGYHYNEDYEVNTTNEDDYVRILPVTIGENSSELFVKIALNRKNEILKSVFSNRLLFYGPISLLILIFLMIGFFEFGFMRKFSIITNAIKNYSESAAKGKLIKLQLGKHKIKEVHLLSTAFEQLSESLLSYDKKLKYATEVEEELKRQKALGCLAAQVAHDIRSPLSSMQTAIEYLGHLRLNDAKGTDVLNLLELSAKRLTGIADDLLNKHQGGEILQNKNIFSIHQALDELVGEFQGQDQYKQIQFVKEYSSQAIHVQGDAAKMQRAFGNVIKNAAEAMEFDGKITLRTSCDQEKSTISITDTGPGMSEAKLQKVLQGGFTEGKADGHGIGTKVVRETVEEHSGQLRGESIIGKGTTFFIDLPLTAHSDKTTTFTLTLNPQETVLVVDDDTGLREQWRLILKEHGIHTLLCDSYEDIVEQGVSPELTPTAMIDYHFENSEKNGVDIVKYLQSIGFKNLYLCTAEYWKPLLQRESNALGVSVCPKPIPKIVIKPPVIASEAKQSSHNKEWIASSPAAPRNDKGYNVLVIDDDTSIRMSWNLMQLKLKIDNLHCYENLEALQTNNIDLSTIDIAFVDKNIDGSQFSGAETIQFLKEKGIPKIILASGEKKETLELDPMFQAVNGILTEKVPKDLEPFFA